MSSLSYVCPNCTQPMEVFPNDTTYQIVTINPTLLYKEGLSELICSNCNTTFYLTLPKE